MDKRGQKMCLTGRAMEVGHLGVPEIFFSIFVVFWRLANQNAEKLHKIKKKFCVTPVANPVTPKCPPRFVPSNTPYYYCVLMHLKTV